MLHRLFLIICLSLILFSCKEQSSESTQAPVQDIPSTPVSWQVSAIQKTEALNQSGQAILIWDDTSATQLAKMALLEKDGSTWVLVEEEISVNIGKAGFAPPGEKREGDKRTPTGVYALGPAFGYQNDLDSKIEFIELLDNHYWISDSEMENYNTIVDYVPESKEVEKMRRNDHLYEYGIVIEYNMEPAIPQMGSAIFFHVERRPEAPTLGCVSMGKTEMIDLIEWVDPDAKPMVILGHRN